MTDKFELAVAGMRALPQWFVWRLVWDGEKAKYRKMPCPLNGADAPLDVSKPANWTSYDVAVAALRALPQVPELRYALGFYVTADCPYWFLDIDKCYQGDVLNPWAQGLIDAYPGVMVERSSSGKGLHLIGSGTAPKHRSKPLREIKASLQPMELEFYTELRGIAFGLDGVATGCADAKYDMTTLVDSYFPPRDEADVGARPEWRGPTDDDVLIDRMLAAKLSAEAAFGGKPSVGMLWRGDCERNSENDMALAAHLAFWTGCDEPRIARIMARSGMVRDKWSDTRPGGNYLTYTIGNACMGCENVYQEPQRMITPTSGDDGSASATSDLANARRLVATHGQDLLHVDGIGWHVWKDGGPWRPDNGHAQRLAFGLGKIIQAEADAMDSWVNDPQVNGSDEHKRRANVQKNLARWARSSEFVVSVRHTLEAAQTMLGEKADALDSSRQLVGTPTGVIDLATGTQREHRREDRITKTIACDFDPSARAPTWQKFIGQIMGNDKELIDYLQTLCGYMLSGERGEHALPVFYGKGANGKSTFLGTVQSLLADYAGTASPGLLLARKDSDQLAAIAALRGLRLVVASESGETERLDESRVKQITGGDRLTGRPLYQNFVEFTPTHLVVLQTNHRPRVNGTDDGIWRRLKLIPFAVTIPEGERDTDLPAKLRAEFPGILAWMVEGWRMYQAHGFREPEAIKMATVEYRSASDQIGQFISERCIIGPEHTSNAAVIYGAYRQWCIEHGENPMTQRALGLRLSERPGVVQVRTTQARGWRGLSIAPYEVLGHVAGQVVPLVRKA